MNKIMFREVNWLVLKCVILAKTYIGVSIELFVDSEGSVARCTIDLSTWLVVHSSWKLYQL